MNSRIVALLICALVTSHLSAIDEEIRDILETYCFDCHDDASAKGNFNLEMLLGREGFDGTLMFENLLTDKMPPADKERPVLEEKQKVLKWLAKQQRVRDDKSFRRI
ncbi:MAG: hypothetical protein PVJ98_02045, partial [Akkermansiaceae bacterium]